LNEDLLDLPWQIQVSLASGYAAYLLGYRGIRFGHSAVDTTFITLIFGLVATAIIALLNIWHPSINPVVSGAVAFLGACVVALLWRRIFRQWLHRFLRAAKISYTDDDPSALATISANNKFGPTQIAVQLDNGTWLRCDYAAKFNESPFGPFVLGPNGDIALYLTHEELEGQPAKELQSVKDKDWGDRITYVPASRIRQITLRHKG
jgi:hypothetical protein